jgi:hypothetical protein
MAHIEEIEKAIVAHSKWKADLRQAIKDGYIHTPVDTIRMDDQCFFGKWLDGPTLTPVERASGHYKKVKERHAEFHETAAHVVELVMAGRKSDAERMMSLGGEYAQISSRLTLAMIDWKKSLG